MATIQEIFGASAVIDSSDAANPVLQIAFVDMPGWDDPSQVVDPDKWLVAILTKAGERTISNPAEVRGCVVADWQAGFVQDVVIDGSQVMAQTYTVSATAYVPSQAGARPDPDDVV